MHVNDIDRSKAFFEALGYHVNPQFTDANAACRVISGTSHPMLLTTDRMYRFLPKGRTIADPTTATETLLALSCESRAAVDVMFPGSITTITFLGRAMVRVALNGFARPVMEGRDISAAGC